MNTEELVLALEERVRLLRIYCNELRETGWLSTADALVVDIHHLENSVRVLKFWVVEGPLDY